MNEVLPSLGGVALFLLAGLGLTEFFPGLRRLTLPSRLGYAYLLGLAVVAGSLYALSHLAKVPLRPPVIYLTFAAPVVAGLIRRALTPWPPLPVPGEGGKRARTGVGGEGSGGGPSKVVIRVIAGLLAFVCLGLFADAVTNPVTGWDGRMTWSTQARYVREEGTVDAEALRNGRWYINHPRYPLLLPVAQVAVLEAFGAEEDRHIFRPLYAALFPAFLLVLGDGARRWAGRVPAALAGLAAAGLPVLTFWQDSGAASAYSDFPLGCFYGAGLVLLLRSRRRVSDAVAAGLLLGAAVLTKNEGFLLAGSALLAALFLLRREGRLRQAARLGAAAALVALALAFFVSWRSEIPERHDEKYSSFVDAGDFWPETFTRIPWLAPVIAREMFIWHRWSLFWAVAPVVFWAGRDGWHGRRRALFWTLLLAFAAPLAVGWGAYTVHWNPLPLIPVTWTRFLVQGSIPLFLLLALALRGALRRMPGRSVPKVLLGLSHRAG
ncbi:MAG TPA: glycosyltransferase family 39 protein [Thermoanaerobaculia bacterium]